jgi:Flp pilus assembly protein TadG
MALILPLLATLTLGIIEMGFLLNYYITVVNLSREGARIAADGATNCEIRSVLFTEGSGSIPTYATDAAVLIARGRTPDTDGANGVWTPDPANPTGWAMRTQSSAVTGQELNTTNGYQFVLVEVQYNHPTITRIPFTSDILVSSRSIVRTAARNVNDC